MGQISSYKILLSIHWLKITIVLVPKALIFSMGKVYRDLVMCRLLLTTRKVTIWLLTQPKSLLDLQHLKFCNIKIQAVNTLSRLTLSSSSIKCTVNKTFFMDYKIIIPEKVALSLIHI